MLKGVLMYVQPAGRVIQRGALQDCRWSHRRSYMEHLILRPKPYVRHPIYCTFTVVFAVATLITFVSPGLSRFSKTASCSSALTSIRFCLRLTLRSRFLTISHKASAYFLTPNSTGKEVLKTMLALDLFPVWKWNKTWSLAMSLEKKSIVHWKVHQFCKMFITAWSFHTFLRKASERYMIFWGAPAHFTGVFGKVNNALPSLKFFSAFQVFSTVCSE